MMSNLRQNQTGETILEVVIATVIIGLAIGLAYGVANRSLRSAQQSQERIEGLKLVEGQIEQLKAFSYVPKSERKGIFDGDGTAFCLYDDTKHNAGPSTIGDLDSSDFSQYNDTCIKGRYHVAVQSDDNRDFKVVVRWYSIGELMKEEVVSIYRLYPSDE